MADQALARPIEVEEPVKEPEKLDPRMVLKQQLIRWLQTSGAVPGMRSGITYTRPDTLAARAVRATLEELTRKPLDINAFREDRNDIEALAIQQAHQLVGRLNDIDRRDQWSSMRIFYEAWREYRQAQEANRRMAQQARRDRARQERARGRNRHADQVRALEHRGLPVWTARTLLRMASYDTCSRAMSLIFAVVHRTEGNLRGMAAYDDLLKSLQLQLNGRAPADQTLEGCLRAGFRNEALADIPLDQLTQLARCCVIALRAKNFRKHMEQYCDTIKPEVLS